MTKRYAIWDKQTDIYTPGAGPDGKSHFTAAEWAAKYPWINAPGAKMIITVGVINGGAAMEFEATKAMYIQQGAEITDGMTDEEVLEAIEAWEDAQSIPDPTPSPEERIAAALEFQTLASLPDEEVE